MGFGDKLRREREMRGVSLEEIAESTKIGTRSLRALEEDDFDKLPGGIFNKGFVRAYSHFLGLDEERTVADFEAALKEYRLSQAPPEQFEIKQEPERTSSKSIWLTIAAVLLIAALMVVGYLLSRPRTLTQSISGQNAAIAPKARSGQDAGPTAKAPEVSRTSPPAKAIPAANQASPVAPGAEAGSSSPTEASAKSSSMEGDNRETTPLSVQSNEASVSAPSVASASPIHLRVFAREESWLSVSADGKDLGQGTLPAQQSRIITAQKEVRLKVGNLGGVEVSFNGKPVNVDGEPKQVKELTFTASGLRQ